MTSHGWNGCGTRRSHTDRASCGRASWMKKSRNTSQGHSTVLSGLSLAVFPNMSVCSGGILSLTLAPSSTTKAVWNTGASPAGYDL